MINFTELLGLKYTAWPEMLAWPYLMIQGWLPYLDIGIAHNPLLLVVLSIFYKLFGLGILQLQIFTWILLIINAYLVYFIAKKFWSTNLAYGSSVLYLLLAIIYEGNGLWFDVALTPFAILAFYFLRSKNYFWSGIFFALGFLTKQTFIYFAAPIAIVLFLENRFKFSRYISFLIGMASIFIPFLIVLYLFGILDDYYNWAIKFGIFYLPQATGQISLPSLREFAFTFLPLLFFVFSKEHLLMMFALAGLIGIYPRFELFHFQPALPFLAILLVKVVLTTKNNLIKIIVLIVIIPFISLGVYRQLGNTIRFYEKDVQDAVLLLKNYDISEIYVANYWDSVYSLSSTIPATRPLIPYIPWYLRDVEKKQIMNDLITSSPKVIIVKYLDSLEFVELKEYIYRYYDCRVVVGDVKICQK